MSNISTLYSMASLAALLVPVTATAQEYYNIKTVKHPSAKELARMIEDHYDCAYLKKEIDQIVCEAEKGATKKELFGRLIQKHNNEVGCMRCVPSYLIPSKELFSSHFITALRRSGHRFFSKKKQEPPNAPPTLGLNAHKGLCNQNRHRTVLFGTNRAIAQFSDALLFSKRRSQSLAFGAAQLRFNSEVTSSKWFAQEDDRMFNCDVKSALPVRVDMHSFRIQHIKMLTHADFSSSAMKAFGFPRTYRKALIFLHGYNTDFKGALLRGGQIAESIKFDGVTFVYSWPSASRAAAYDYDRASVLASRNQLRWFLQKIQADFDFDEINIIAHSMGNQLAVEVLQQFEALYVQLPVRIKLIMAAPDVDINVFSSNLLAIQQLNVSITQYVSSWDRALWASHLKAGEGRVGGFSGGRPRAYVGIDVVDISSRASTTGLNHSIFAEDGFVLADLKKLVEARGHRVSGKSTSIRKIESPH